MIGSRRRRVTPRSGTAAARSSSVGGTSGATGSSARTTGRPTRGHLIAGPSGLAARIGVHAVNPPYSLELRREAVRLLRTSDRSIPQLANELGCSPQSLPNRSRQLDSKRARLKA